MGFIHTTAWTWIAGAVVIVICYLWCFRRRRREVATLQLWQQTIAKRPTWFVARFWLSLSLQIALLLTLVLILAEPYFKSVVASRRNVILIVDVSASMSAIDLKPTRLAHAKATARKLIGDLRRGEYMAIISAGSEVRPVCRYTADLDRLYATLARLRPTDGVSNIQDAVGLARELSRHRDNSRIVVLTDGGFEQVREIAEAQDIKMVLYGDNGANLGITQFELRPSLTKPLQYEAFVAVEAHVTELTNCELQFRLQDSEPQRKQLRFAAGSNRTECSFSIDVAASGLAIAQLKVEDALAADNDAFVLVPSRQPQTVILVSPPDSVVESAMRVIPQLDLTVVQEPPIEPPAGAVVIYNGVTPENLPLGPTMIIGPSHSCDAWDFLGVLRDDDCTIRHAQNESSLLADIDINGVLVEQASKLQLSTPAENIIVSLSGDPLYAAMDRPGGKALVWNINLQRSDLRLRPDFPILMRNAIRWLSARPQTYRPANTTSDVVQLPTSEKVRQSASPTGLQIKIASGSNVLALNQAGIWRVSDANSSAADPSVILAVNLADARESNLLHPANATSDEIDAVPRPQNQPLWMFLLGAVIVALVTESCLFHRRITV